LLNVMPSGFYNMDCMDAMKRFPDKFFDLAIVDPPYGDGNSEIGGGVRFGGIFDRYKILEPIRTTVRQIQEPGTDSRGEQPSENISGGGAERTGGTWAEKYGKKIIAWDVAPEQSYFEELFRVSRNQIIWGGNYFQLPPTRCFLIWKKLTISESFSMAMAEYAWTSLKGNAKVYEAAPQGTSKEQRFHPTQKPISLYSWILNLYAKPGMRILDTHVGSASSLVACHRAGLEYWGYEIDPTYYQLAKERLDRECAQVNLFEQVPEEKAEQISLI